MHLLRLIVLLLAALSFARAAHAADPAPAATAFRALASNGIDHPVLNVFRMFSKMSGQRLPVTSSAAVSLDAILKDGVRAQPDVSALASLDGRKLCVLAWHYHDDDVPGPDATVELSLHGLPAPDGPIKVQHFRIDATHSNAFTAWQHMGSPQPPTPAQLCELEGAGQLAALPSPDPLQIKSASATLQFTLPRQAVSLFVAEW